MRKFSTKWPKWANISRSLEVHVLEKRCWRCWLLSALITLAPTLGFTNFAAQNWTMDNGHAVWLLFWKNALGRAFLVPAGFQGFSHELHLVRSRDCPHTTVLGHHQHHHPQPLAKMLNHGHEHRRHFHPKPPAKMLNHGHQPHDNMIKRIGFHEKTAPKLVVGLTSLDPTRESSLKGSTGPMKIFVHQILVRIHQDFCPWQGSDNLRVSKYRRRRRRLRSQLR